MILKKSKHKRVWLDPKDPDTMSYVAYSLTNREGGNLNIADCNRKINIGFWRKKDIKKLDKLIDVLSEFRDQLDNINFYED